MRTNLSNPLLDVRSPVALDLLPEILNRIRNASMDRIAPVNFDSFIAFYTAEEASQGRPPSNNYEFCFVVEGLVHEQITTRIYFYVSDTGMGSAISARTLCSRCRTTTRICPHGNALAQQFARRELIGDPVKFLGYFEDENWCDDDIDITRVDGFERGLVPDQGQVSLSRFLSVPVQIPEPRVWPEGHQIVLQVTDLHVQFDNGAKRPVVEQLFRTPDGELVQVAFESMAPPEDERSWADRLEGMGRTASERLHFPRNATDGRSLVEFAKAGRLYRDGSPVEYAGDLESVLGWEPDTEQGQRLVLKLDPPLTWMCSDHGPILCATGLRLASLPLSSMQLETLLALPALADEQADQVREAWSQHRVLGESLMPLKPAERHIEERQLTWSTRLVQLNDEETADLGGEGGIAVRIELLDDQTPVALSVRDGQLVHIEDDLWFRYRIKGEAPDKLAENLVNLFKFTARTLPTRRDLVAASETTLSEATLALSLVPGGQNVKLPKSAMLSRLAFRTPGSLALQAEVVKADKATNPYELRLTGTLGPGPVDVPLLIERIRAKPSWLLHRVAASLATQGDWPRVIEVSAGVFAPMSATSYEKACAHLNTLLDHSVRQGRRHYLTEGALLRLATTAGLPLADTGPIRQARGTVSRLLRAQGEAPARAIDGIEGITFSPKQAAGVNWLVALREANLGGVLADKRGAGKTFMALGAIAQTRAMRKASGHGPAVVAMELKELDHWVVKHLMRCCHGLKWEVFHGNRKADHDTLMQADLVVTTYGVLQRHVDRFLALNPSYIFADEAKRLKNRRSKTWQAVHSFPNSSIISINGTPLTKNVPDIWSGFELAAPGFLGSLSAFVGSYRENADDATYLDRLREAMKPLFIRRDIDNGRGMPSKTLIPQLIKMDKAQSVQYIQARERLMQQKVELEESLPRSQANFRIRQMIDRLRAITASPGRPRHLTSKGESILEMVSEFVQDDHQVLVFSHSNTYVDSIAEILRSDGISTSVYRGANARERNREKTLFQEGHSRVLVLSDLGAKGLDLPEASRVVITDPWLDADEEDQKADRARRFVSTKDLEVFHLICSGTLEEGAMGILERNRERERAILEGAPAPAPGMAGKTTADDYDHLLSFLPPAGD